jgi:hypothetical protein
MLDRTNIQHGAGHFGSGSAGLVLRVSVFLRADNADNADTLISLGFSVRSLSAVFLKVRTNLSS